MRHACVVPFGNFVPRDGSPAPWGPTEACCVILSRARASPWICLRKGNKRKRLKDGRKWLAHAACGHKFFKIPVRTVLVHLYIFSNQNHLYIYIYRTVNYTRIFIACFHNHDICSPNDLGAVWFTTETCHATHGPASFCMAAMLQWWAPAPNLWRVWRWIWPPHWWRVFLLETATAATKLTKSKQQPQDDGSHTLWHGAHGQKTKQ